MLKDLYQSKKIVSSLRMNYEKIDAYKKNCMLFWKEHKDDTECMHCGRSRYVKVINKDGASVTTKVVVKQLRYIPITPRLKRLFVCEETAQQMRWHKEGIRDSEDPDIMSHHANAEVWHALDRFDPEFARDPRRVRLGLSTDGFQPYSSNSTASNIKQAVNVSTGKLNGLKSHDYYIIIQRLMPIMFRGYFDANLWEIFTELGYFYRQICPKQVSKSMMQKLEKEIAVLICNMEKVLPPGWFNRMQHLLVHLPWEAKV
jgi:hypothetical protein